MQENYDAQQIELEAQDYWQENQVFKVTEDKDKEKF